MRRCLFADRIYEVDVGDVHEKKRDLALSGLAKAAALSSLSDSGINFLDP
jgi:hypothetical protein